MAKLRANYILITEISLWRHFSEIIKRLILVVYFYCSFFGLEEETVAQNSYITLE